MNDYSVTQFEAIEIEEFVHDMIQAGYSDLACAVLAYHHFSVDVFDIDSYENLYVNFSSMLKLGAIIKLYLDFHLHHDFVFDAYNQVIANRRNGIKPEYL